ncbi:serine hydrolase domain-containing protein [Algoriphagus yeomjeoni]|uniref:CubicO group peptidase (Beta-lactamase class C family) n=1 Tax=Algoriphagus yeomjeoni TaxID=291403 RepID=A0A327PBQ9_9BACT|nr:serine hydrolase domain-containing protein [Algoriphagus yeomjeoni]RAI88482.1 CubicO group peptidase (beta-lactamase class C family) [Algoriphagus yeomjeoni]
MKNRYLIKIVLSAVLLAFLLVPIHTFSQTNSGDLEKIVDSLFIGYSNQNEPGVIIGIMKNDSIILKKAYGSSNIELNVPISNETKFHIASLTKQFTAFAIAQLEGQGKLSYQDDIRNYLPELNDFGRVITIDHLLHHTSGLRSSNRLRLLQDDFYETILTQENALQLIFAQKELNFDPGSEFGYSNSGYILLATIVERISNMKFSEWLEQNVFQPLDMNQSIVVSGQAQQDPNKAIPYEKNGDGYKQTMGMDWLDYGATGIYSTIEDLVKWQRYLHSLNYMWLGESSSSFPYGMGLYVVKSSEGDIEQIYHTGDGVGYISFMSYYPMEQLDVILLSNLNSNEPIRLAEEIVGILNSKNKNLTTEIEPQLEVPLEILEIYAGTYDAEQFKPEFEIKDSQLYALSSQGADLLVALNETTFVIPNTPVQFEFDKAGQYVILKMPDNELKFPRITPEEVSHTIDLSDYTGIYYSPELDVSYSLKVDNNQLVAESPKNRRIVFGSIAMDTTESEDRYFRNIHFSRDENNRINGLRVTDIDGRVRNLWFEKKE